MGSIRTITIDSYSFFSIEFVLYNFCMILGYSLGAEWDSFMMYLCNSTGFSIKKGLLP